MMDKMRDAERAGPEVRLTLLRAADYVLATLAGLCAFILYLRTVAPGLLGADSGEFQFTAWLGGFAHPTGYPLYLILGYLWTHLLPLHDPAWRLNVLSAVWGAVAVALVFLLSLRILQIVASPRRDMAIYRALALVAALTFAVTPTFWSQAVIAEVYTLNAALVAGLLLSLVILTERICERRADIQWPLAWAASCFGLGLAHHRTMILLAPALALYLWYGPLRGKPRRTRVARLLRVLPLILVPLALYVYIPLRAPQAPYAQVNIGAGQVLQLYEPDLQGFLTYVTGKSFSPELRQTQEALQQLGPAVQRLLAELSWPGVVLGALGAAWLGRRRKSLLALTGLCLVSLTIFNLYYGIGDIYVYYIPIYMIWSVWIALGVAALGDFWSTVRALHQTSNQGRPAGAALAGLRARSVPPPPPPLAVYLSLALLALALPGWLLVTGYGHIDQSHNDSASQMWQAIFSADIPRDAIVISNDRDEMTPLWYCQYVQGQRPDLTGLFPLLGPPAEWGDIGQVVDIALRSGRPVLLIKPMPGLEVKFKVEPAGGLVRVLGPAVEKAPERARVFVYGDTIRLSGYELRPGVLSGNGTATVTLYWQALHSMSQDYTSFVHIVDADGNMVAQDDHRPGGVYYPTHLWRAGELLKDEHVLALPASLGRAPFGLVAGLYYTKPVLTHLGRPEQIGLVSSQRPADQMPKDLAHPLNFTFDDQVSLNGYEMNVQEQTLSMRLYWQALRTPELDYTAFVHVVDADGNIVAQCDQQPANGDMPLSTWPRGYILADSMVIHLPGNLPAGKYRLEAGLYDSATVTPLPVFNDKGRPAGSAAPLGELAWPPAN